MRELTYLQEYQHESNILRSICFGISMQYEMHPASSLHNSQLWAKDLMTNTMCDADIHLIHFSVLSFSPFSTLISPHTSFSRSHLHLQRKFVYRTPPNVSIAYRNSKKQMHFIFRTRQHTPWRRWVPKQKYLSRLLISWDMVWAIDFVKVTTYR